MSKQTETSLFMFPPKSQYAAFYQGLLRSALNYEQLGNRLIRLGEQAHTFRQFDRVKEIGMILSNLPIKNYQAIGFYFLAVAANNNGNGDQEKARKLFEMVAGNAPQAYRAKAILSLAAVSANTGDHASELYYFRESIKAAHQTDLYTLLKAHKGIAVLRARADDHRHSLKYLESFLPLIKYADANVYFDYLNSLAVELGQTGRKHEARDICRVILASPLAWAYPEWLETAKELREPSRSFLAVNPVRGSNVVRLTPRSITSEDKTAATVYPLTTGKNQRCQRKRSKSRPLR